jgi:hypothetical protein
MTTYYDYLRDKIATAPQLDRMHLEHLVDAERNALWQMLVSNPAYDERSRMGALAAFDEAAGRIFSESERRAGNGSTGRPVAIQQGVHRGESRGTAGRSWTRDLLFLVMGALLGFAAAYFGGTWVERTIGSLGLGQASGVPRLVASNGTYKFSRSNPPALTGEIAVENGPDASQCAVEATYRQLLEYVRFEPGCRTVSFKFRPLPDLFENFNYLQGYMIFTTTIGSAGKSWKGTASVYFSIDASA